MQPSATPPLTEIITVARSRTPQAQHQDLTAFIDAFFHQVAPEDLAGRPVDDLCGSVLSLWQFARQRAATAPAIRIINPATDTDGWQSPHTVIEIVQRDMPFLVDSIRMAVNAMGLATHLIIHPVVAVRRNANGVIDGVCKPAEATADMQLESCMQLEISRETDAPVLADLKVSIETTLRDVSFAVNDWQAMLGRMQAVIADINAAPPPVDADELAEGVTFLEWLTAGHFTFLGCRDYELVQENGDDVLRIVTDSGYGILREMPGQEVSTSFATLPQEIRERARVRELLIVTKSNSRSTVHRPVYMDYVGVKRFDAAGNVVGERRFLGLFTSRAYSSHAQDIPLLRVKVNDVMRASGVQPGSHLGKALLAILETYPRDELFQIEPAELLRIATGILHLDERQRTRLFIRRDPFNRFFTCMVYVPRDAYTTDARERMQQFLLDALAGRSCEFSTSISESMLARILFMIHTSSGRTVEIDERRLEADLARLVQRWEDELASALIQAHGEERGRDVAKQFARAFPPGYKAEYAASRAVADIDIIRALHGDDDIGMSLYLPVDTHAGDLRFKLFRTGQPVPLSQSLPMLEHMGVRVLDERPEKITPEGLPPVWVHDIGLTLGAGERFNLDRLQTGFMETFHKVWCGEAESDDLNKLVLRAALNWRQVTLLRALVRYARQAGVTFSQTYMENALAAHPAIARQLVELFVERHDPRLDLAPAARGVELTKEIITALDAVTSLDEDRILRLVLTLIGAVTRTNYFQQQLSGQAKGYLSFKFDPSLIPVLPEPRPMFEIYVYSPRMEGVHLRGGKVARGGLRWSDRMEDFRTEVLGLMKAQMVKNAVIVPVGAKGGFIVKQLPESDDREVIQREVIACYSTFIRGLLDLTDNRKGKDIIAPSQVVRHDEDDDYLVVAADKGTATFSDIANGIAIEYGFWLGDAFASGGSAGYDHKKMGITARGAWESVKKHFRRLDRDIQTTPFTVAGVGDMSGDVFGNGMLLSRATRLVAAFDHRHIFLDPEPDAATSYAERERLFALPRSSWADYDKALISAGGGVYPRSLKSIQIAKEVRQLLAIDDTALPPAELIRAILRAPVDLLYNGGIGTYVKAKSESNSDVGDRANDAVRVNGAELRCKVVGEGGNLGFTQKGRAEFAAGGGLIYTDAIDNSGGVDCSDHEVNIKILLNTAAGAGTLNNDARNALLASMTDEVAALVLRNNYHQALALALDDATGPELLDAQARFIRFLERDGRLNRLLESLPDDETLAQRRAARDKLRPPENAVLLAHAKLWLFDEVLASNIPEDVHMESALLGYFPAALRKDYGDDTRRHPLRREIICTHVCSSMVNRVGSTFVFNMMEETAASPADVVRAYLLTRECFGVGALWRALKQQDNVVADALQTRMLLEVGRLLSRGTRWFLRRRNYLGDLARSIEELAPAIEATAALLKDHPAASPDIIGQRTREYVEQGVDETLAQSTAVTAEVHAALDIHEVARATTRSVPQTLSVYLALSQRLELPALRERIGQLPGDNHWQLLARAALRDDLADRLRALTAVVLKRNPGLETPDALVGAWEQANPGVIGRTRQVLQEIQSAGTVDLAMLSVGLRELRNLA
ncbi:MAG: NAD-glutamate dehydrogenase [Gammaproteobacteria bacterium]|nr:NAD-glutamate dehydrogenase [Gammaproteobacteria bacterium]